MESCGENAFVAGLSILILEDQKDDPYQDPSKLNYAAPCASNKRSDLF